VQGLDVFGADGALLGTLVADVPRERAGVDAADAADAVALEVLVERAL